MCIRDSCGAFPFLAGETTTVTNMGIIYTSSPIFIILISAFFFNEKINFVKIIGLVSCLIGVFTIIIGLMLSNYPGKYVIEKKFIAIPAILKSINWLRAKSNAPPLKIN